MARIEDEDIKRFKESLKEILSKEDNQSFKKREFLKSITDEVFRTHYEGETRETVPYEIGLSAYKYILENGGSPQEAFEYSVEIHNRSLEWFNNIKNNPYYHSKRIVIEHDNHPEQKLMLSNGIMDKSALKKSDTVNQQIRRLSRYKRVSDQLEYLKENDSKQQKEINNLKGKVETHSRQIDKITERTGIDKMSNKEIAYIMYQNNCTQKEVSEEVGVHINTVKRWWKGFKNDTL